MANCQAVLHGPGLVKGNRGFLYSSPSVNATLRWLVTTSKEGRTGYPPSLCLGAFYATIMQQTYAKCFVMLQCYTVLPTDKHC
jgi:hypothetical protein